MKHIFVLAMDELQRTELETICEADNYRFHNHKHGNNKQQPEQAGTVPAPSLAAFR